MSAGDIFRSGLPVEDALQVFNFQVNHPDTIFSTDHWLTPKLQELRTLLSDPITADQAQALNDVLYGRHFMRDLIEWLRSPKMPWAHFFAYREERKRNANWARWKRHEKVRRKVWGRRPNRPQSCPRCGSRAVLDIVYGYPSPEAWEAARRGAVALGGCCLFRTAPSWCCRVCRHCWPEEYKA